MTLTLSKTTFVLMAAIWYIIRFKHAERASRIPVRLSGRGRRETALLLVSLSGLGFIPLLYIATGFPRFANYAFQPHLAWLGGAVALCALALFQITHRALGRNWSVSLDVRESHKLVTDGIYHRVRHPMYTAFWLWALAQALLLPNWIAGFSGLIGFGILFFGRLGREERMMLNAFGSDYALYMSRTSRVVPFIY